MIFFFSPLSLEKDFKVEVKAYPSEENKKEHNSGQLNVDLQKEIAQWTSEKKLSMGINY